MAGMSWSSAHDRPDFSLSFSHLSGLAIFLPAPTVLAQASTRSLLGETRFQVQLTSTSDEPTLRSMDRRKVLVDADSTGFRYVHIYSIARSERHS